MNTNLKLLEYKNECVNSRLDKTKKYPNRHKQANEKLESTSICLYIKVKKDLKLPKKIITLKLLGEKSLNKKYVFVDLNKDFSLEDQSFISYSSKELVELKKSKRRVYKKLLKEGTFICDRSKVASLMKTFYKDLLKKQKSFNILENLDASKEQIFSAYKNQLQISLSADKLVYITRIGYLSEEPKVLELKIAAIKEALEKENLIIKDVYLKADFYKILKLNA